MREDIGMLPVGEDFAENTFLKTTGMKIFFACSRHQRHYLHHTTYVA
jgi:hypothetical protein